MANKPKDVKKRPAKKIKLVCMDINNVVIEFKDRAEKMGLKVNNSVEVLSTDLGKECMKITAFPGGKDENKIINIKQKEDNDREIG